MIMLDASDFVLLPTCNVLMFTLRNQVQMYAGEFAYLQSRGAKKKICGEMKFGFRKKYRKIYENVSMSTLS